MSNGKKKIASLCKFRSQIHPHRMKKHPVTSLLPLLTLLLIGTSQAHATSAPQEDPAITIINAVNEMRVANGLNVLNIHPALMEVAQWEANAIAGGAPGHVRPPGLTLGQWLISLDYPLAGNLSLDGYRSENWVSAQSADQAIQFWLGDGPHTNTMLSPDRSDIGAAVVGDIYVLETALQTANGEMQSTAYEIQTAMPASQAELTSNYIVPVFVSTARPDGDVIHQVAYGQSLWSVAIAYNTSIDQIRRWNNMREDEQVYEGEILLVQKAATQPADTSVTAPATMPEMFSAPPATSTPTLHPTVTPTLMPATTPEANPANPAVNRAVLVVILLIALIGGAWLALSMRMPEE